MEGLLGEALVVRLFLKQPRSGGKQLGEPETYGASGWLVMHLFMKLAGRDKVGQVPPPPFLWPQH